VEGKVRLIGFTTQREIVRLQAEADALLLTSWPVPEQISGKFYEYIATPKPIVYVTDHETDVAADYLHEHGMSQYICRHTPEDIAALLTRLRDDARAGKLPTRQPEKGVGYDARAAAYLEMLGGLLDKQTRH
jgi:CBS domain-containing protein